MDLIELIKEKKEEILNRWFDMIVESYPKETGRFLKTKKDRFSNPIGYIIKETITNIFDNLLKGNLKDIDKIVNEIVKIRAVQDFKPSEAVGFIFQLKYIIYEELEKLNKPMLIDELREIEKFLDNIGLISFDIYMKCREKIYELKANEVRNWTYKVLEKANLLKEVEKKSF